ncbi:HIRAN domain-containing protein [uncultured Methanobrevibacter sp.]|uniref:HIRAN domain-containing protein n=1 Tax=uncultured Methanobrevibacter sp. TaxID=253161 RepID=UPI002611FA30|nr:HIRAN domain-containing protein [uncultured Methanobrevibacter sp.]
MKDDMYITLIGMKHYFGIKPFKKDGIIKLIKEKDNNYDYEAIKVEMRHAGQVAYVSNSTNTVIRGTMSAGRIYDKILDEDYAQIKFYNNEITIAKILTPDEIDELKKDPENDLNFI